MKNEWNNTYIFARKEKHLPYRFEKKIQWLWGFPHVAVWAPTRSKRRSHKQKTPWGVLGLCFGNGTKCMLRKVVFRKYNNCCKLQNYCCNVTMAPSRFTLRSHQKGDSHINDTKLLLVKKHRKATNFFECRTCQISMKLSKPGMLQKDRNSWGMIRGIYLAVWFQVPLLLSALKLRTLNQINKYIPLCIPFALALGSFQFRFGACKTTPLPSTLERTPSKLHWLQALIVDLQTCDPCFLMMSVIGQLDKNIQRLSLLGSCHFPKHRRRCCCCFVVVLSVDFLVLDDVLPMVTILQIPAMTL